MSHVVQHMKNDQGDNSPMVRKRPVLFGNSHADNTSFGSIPMLGKSESSREKRARSSHRVTTLAAWTNDEKMEKLFLVSIDATTMGWNESRVSSSTSQRMQRNCGLVANSAIQFALYSVGVASTLCVAPRHDRAIFLDGSESVAVTDDVANTCGQLAPD